MSRPLRIEVPGAVYHITSRGNARQKIYEENKDRKQFLSLIGHVVYRYGWLCHAYCLMDNHYHMLIETPQPNLSYGMRQLNGLYTQMYNKRHGRVGHLFQGYYKSILVEKESHLLELCRYVVLNPVRAKIVDHPAKWKWSSYRAPVGMAPAQAFLTVNWILEQFGSRLHEAQVQYQAYVLNCTDIQNPWEKLRGDLYLGTEELVTKLQTDYPIPEIPRIQFMVNRPELKELFDSDNIDGQQDLDQVILEAYNRYGYHMSEIARHLNVHYATISRHIKRTENKDADV